MLVLRLWINESKANNIQASQAAVKVYADQKLIFILGGDDKSKILKPLLKTLNNIEHLRLYAIGVNKNSVVDLAKDYTYQSTACEDLKEAVDHIKSDLAHDEIIMLSPSASLDELECYNNRIDLHKILIN